MNLQFEMLSNYYKTNSPSPIRLAQIEFLKRNDIIDAINLSIGNVSLPMHQSMQKRLFNLNSKKSPFKNGIVKYVQTDGTKEANKAFMNSISASGFSTKELYSIITDGASQSMELIIAGTCGAPGTTEKPLLLIDAAYTNYLGFAKRIGRKIVSYRRLLSDNSSFEDINIDKIEKLIHETNPGALLIIPYDNPTGNYIDQTLIINLAKLCVKYNMWLISDEAYRELYYGNSKISSIWGVTEEKVKNITGKRISIESASKVWNACGLRIGALVTDNKYLYKKTINDYSANLCANTIGQYIFGALAHETHKTLQQWFIKQKNYYNNIMSSAIKKFKITIPDLIISKPQSAIYSVIDVKKIVKKEFNSIDFMLFCAKYGKINIDGNNYTLLLAPMSGFYNLSSNEIDPGLTQFRIAYVDSYNRTMLAPQLFKNLLEEYNIK